MKKGTKWSLGGLQGKIFRLCIFLVITAITGFAIVGIIQLSALQRMASDTGKYQAGIIREQSEDSMMQMTEENMKNLAYQAADNTDWELWEILNEAVLLAEQAQDIFANPDNYGERPVELPKKENDGKFALQVLTPDGKEPSEEDRRILMKLANLEPLMKKLIIENEYATQDLLIALPNGVSLDFDTMSGQKFLEDGSVRPYSANVRPWYINAVEAKAPVLTHAVHSYLLDVSEIEFGVPIYVDGKLAAVVESSVTLEKFHEFVSKVTYGKSGFSIVVSDEGMLVYSPRDEGELKMDNMLSSDIYQIGNKELTDVVTKALSGETGFTEITVDGKLYCVSYAPMVSVNWTQMMFVEKEELEKPTEDLLVQMDEITGQTLREYENSFKKSAWLTLFVMILLVVNAALVALLFSGRLTTPINRMTESVRQISGDNFNFEMGEIYRTGDEIELLAETFGELSERTKKYIREITEITAEKERIGAELSIAAEIQADALPKNFPLFPDRKDFDVYATMTPAKQVGGDFYDIFMIDDDHLCLIMADVSGKGMPAALFMMVSKALLQNRALMGGTPSEILEDVNKRLSANNTEMMFVTVWLAIITLSTGNVIEANAGHEDPVIKKKDGEYELIKTKHGIVLGAYGTSRYKNNEYTIEPGDRIFVYTDGIPEATDAKGERYELDRMTESLNRHRDDNPEELLAHVREDVDEFVGEAEQFDDMTMLSFVYKSDGVF